MAKKAELKNVPSLQGVSIFRNGLPPVQQPEPETAAPVTPAPVTPPPVRASTPANPPVQRIARAPLDVELFASPPPASPAPETVSAAEPLPITPAPAASASVMNTHVSPLVQNARSQEEKKMLRSYHLPESLIQRLEDAQMVYQLRKEKTNKQDIVLEALTRYLDELEQQGFFNILKALRA